MMFDESKNKNMIISSIILLGIMIFVGINIYNNAIYYALHMLKTEDTYPEYWMTVRFFHSGKIPEDMRPAPFDGGYAKSDYFEIYPEDKGYSIHNYINSDIYFFNKKGKLTEIYSKPFHGNYRSYYKFTRREIEEAYDAASNFLNPS